MELDCRFDIDVNMRGLVNSRVKVVSPTTAIATNITELISLGDSLYVRLGSSHSHLTNVQNVHISPLKTSKTSKDTTHESLFIHLMCFSLLTI